jgi:hypothetical protein
VETLRAFGGRPLRRPGLAAARVAARGSMREAPSLICALPAAARAVPAARRMVAAALSAWGVTAEVIADAELIASELTTNAVVHGAAPIELRLYQIGDSLAVAVADAHDDTPERVSIRGVPTRGGEQPLSLRVVAGVAAAWSISRHPAGHAKRVTALLRSSPA